MTLTFSHNFAVAQRTGVNNRCSSNKWKRSWLRVVATAECFVFVIFFIFPLCLYALLILFCWQALSIEQCLIWIQSNWHNAARSSELAEEGWTKGLGLVHSELIKQEQAHCIRRRLHRNHSILYTHTYTDRYINLLVCKWTKVQRQAVNLVANGLNMPLAKCTTTNN